MKKRVQVISFIFVLIVGIVSISSIGFAGGNDKKKVDNNGYDNKIYRISNVNNYNYNYNYSEDYYNFLNEYLKNNYKQLEKIFNKNKPNKPNLNKPNPIQPQPKPSEHQSKPNEPQPNPNNNINSQDNSYYSDVIGTDNKENQITNNEMNTKPSSNIISDNGSNQIKDNSLNSNTTNNVSGKSDVTKNNSSLTDSSTTEEVQEDESLTYEEETEIDDSQYGLDISDDGMKLEGMEELNEEKKDKTKVEGYESIKNIKYISAVVVLCLGLIVAMVFTITAHNNATNEDFEFEDSIN